MGAEGVPLLTTVGALRPTIPAYALIGRELVMYEIETVHLFFPSSIGASRHCYQRYAPDYPPFAQLVNAGRAKTIEAVTLKAGEAAELMKFFNSAAGVQAQSFMLSDLAAIAITGSSSAGSLASCLKLAPGSPANESTGWEHGTAIEFRAEDKLWQALIAMLAAKRILLAEDR